MDFIFSEIKIKSLRDFSSQLKSIKRDNKNTFTSLLNDIVTEKNALNMRHTLFKMSKMTFMFTFDRCTCFTPTFYCCIFNEIIKLYCLSTSFQTLIIIKIKSITDITECEVDFSFV